MTWADKIRAMTDDELAEYLSQETEQQYTDPQEMLRWLRTEADNPLIV